MAAAVLVVVVAAAAVAAAAAAYRCSGCSSPARFGREKKRTEDGGGGDDDGSSDEKRKEQRQRQQRQKESESVVVRSSPNGEAFSKAAERVRNLDARKMSNGERLLLYGLYKQALEGDATKLGFASAFAKTSPRRWAAEHAKRNTWLALRGMPREEAVARYVSAVESVEQRIAQGIGAADDDDDDDEAADAEVLMEGMAPAVSRPEVLGQQLSEQQQKERDDKSPQSALLTAASSNDVDAIRKLLGPRDADGTVADAAANLVDINYPDPLDGSGQTALHLACDKNAVDAVRLLLERGADVNARDNDGISVLQGAVIAGNVQVCRLLLERGADPDLPDLDGDTPRSCADDDGSEDLRALFAEQ